MIITAHFHAKYAGLEAIFGFDGTMLDGALPKRAEKLVRDWLELHEEELRANWQKAMSGEPLDYIAPLV